MTTGAEAIKSLETRGEQWYGAMAGSSGLERAKRNLEAFFCLMDAMFLAERTGLPEEAQYG